MPKIKEFEVVIQSAVPKSLLDVVEDEAKANGMSKSHLIRNIMTAWAVSKGYLSPATKIV